MKLVTQRLFIAVIAIWMLVGGTAHFLIPEYFYSIVPNFLPKKFVVYASGVPEILIGLGVLWPKTRHIAGLGFSLLCLSFLPLHIWDLFRDDPAITPFSAAIIRVVLQGVFIWIGWKVWQFKSV
jgi:uncharacterized membrane protein